MRQVERDDVGDALRVSKRAFLATGGFSLVLNVLTLIGPLYMMQVYDRVMTSRSVPTLVALSIFVVILYGLSGFLDLVRSRIMTRISLAFDSMAAGRVFDASARVGLMKGHGGGYHLREFDTLRQFLSGPGPGILFDVPWMPIYIGLLFLFHWSLGVVALASALLLFSLAVITERRTSTAVGEATLASRRAHELAEAGHANAEVLAAMGMLASFRQRWLHANRAALMIQTRSGNSVATLTALSKTFRMILQSAILGQGAYLAIHGDISAGAIIAGSILLGRALAPVEQTIAQWKGVVRARQAYLSLRELLKALPEESERIELPRPSGRLEVRQVRLAPPGAQRISVSNVSFSIGPGQVLAIAGQSASGKSTLARALVGVWPVLGGEIRLDGARLDQWDPQRLGQFMGYVPQDVELFSGTVRDNICRFDPEADDQRVIAAAKLARAHSLILDLQQGYDTELGAFGSHLSAGQKQRIALARALYGDPPLLIFDEPNSNLDSDGDAALMEAIGELRAKQRTVIIVSHRTSAIAAADMLLILEKGQQRAFGPRDEVLRSLAGQGAQPGPAQAVAQPVPQPVAPPASQPVAQPKAQGAPQSAHQAAPQTVSQAAPQDGAARPAAPQAAPAHVPAPLPAAVQAPATARAAAQHKDGAPARGMPSPRPVAAVVERQPDAARTAKAAAPPRREPTVAPATRGQDVAVKSAAMPGRAEVAGEAGSGAAERARTRDAALSRLRARISAMREETDAAEAHPLPQRRVGERSPFGQ